MMAERVLWSSVLVGAISDYFGAYLPGVTDPVERRSIRDEARDWIFARDSFDIGTFLWCCQALELSPTAIRVALRKTPQSQRGRHLSTRSIFAEASSHGRLGHGAEPPCESFWVLHPW